MPSRRDIIRMTPDEIRRYLGGRSRVIVVSHGVNGFPHPVPMNYGLDEQDRLLVTSFAKSQKVKNLERDARASLLVESGEVYAELKSVIVYAQAEIIRDAEAVRRLLPQINASGSLKDSVSSAMSSQVSASFAKRVVLRFKPLRFVSWDHAKLDGFY